MTLQTTTERAAVAELPVLMPIAERWQETADSFSIALHPPGDFAFLPGQCNMLYVPGYGEVPISISGSCDDPKRLVHTIRAVGSVTRAMARLGVGDVVGVRGPFGTPWPTSAEPDAELVVVAGGIGLAPVRPLIRQALARGQRLTLVYGARSPDQLLFHSELEAWERDRRLECIVTVDHGDLTHHGRTGTVTKFLPRLTFDARRASAFVCGPEVMMRFVARGLVEAGMPARRIYLSLERNMQCGQGHCGRCQLGPRLLCQQGPVVSWDVAEPLMNIPEY